ncbi:MAG TPA: EF-hand domain-containing protein [Planctomycetia bacterium]|nr:EF-hand domain-containing protein [Planctomycetia bacterium]
MIRTMGAIAMAAALGAPAEAQAPRGGGGPPGKGAQNRGGDDSAAFIAQMMRYDVNGDGKLSGAEASDPRVAAIFARADGDNDGVVTRDELAKLHAQETGGGVVRGRGGAMPGGKGGLGQPPGLGAGGGPPGKPAGLGGPPPGGAGLGAAPVGQLMPESVQNELNLTKQQRQKIAALQKQIDAKIAQILTAEQKAQWEARGAGPPEGGEEGGLKGGPPGLGKGPPPGAPPGGFGGGKGPKPPKGDK